MDQKQNLENLWMPFSANRAFKSKPRLMNEAKGMYYKKLGGESVLDATSGLWCCNAGHNHPKIVEAIRQQAGKLDYAPSFQMGHPLGFKAAEELLKFSPSPDFKYTFFTNSGSESVDTALKIALGYHQLRGKKEKTILVGRERAYHGVGFGGISVGGLPLNKKHFSLLENVDHISSTHNIDKNAFSKGLPDWGADLANDLLRIIKKHGADKIAAFITEPLAGSTGVLVPPKGYLEKIRKICTDHDILLIFDEVITGFGRLGTPFASQYFNVIPDMIVCAKGLTSGTVPMGAVLLKKKIYDSFQNANSKTIELFHGYTYSAHPLAAAALIATLEVYNEEGLFERANELAPYWEDALHSLKGTDYVIDIRNLGLVGGIEMSPKEEQVGLRGYDVFENGFHEENILLRFTGDIIALSPPLIIEKKHIDKIVSILINIIPKN